MAAICLRSLATAVPDKHASMLRALLNSTTMEYAELTSCKPEEVKIVCVVSLHVLSATYVY
jgi:hypothetical protein